MKTGLIAFLFSWDQFLTLVHSEQPKLHKVLVILSAIGLKKRKVILTTYYVGWLVGWG